MPSRKNWNKRPEQAIAEHKFVHFRDISYGCSKEKFAQLLSSQGYDNCIVYWPNEQKSDKHSHRGFCQVQFPDSAIAASAKTAFSGYAIAGRLINTANVIPPAPRQKRPAEGPQPGQRPAPVAPVAPVFAPAPWTRAAHPGQGGLNQFRHVGESLQSMSITSPSSPFPSSLAASSSHATQSADTSAAPTMASTSLVPPVLPILDSPAPLPTSDAARASLASRKLSAFPESWRFDMEDPEAAPAAYTSYRSDLFDAYTEAGVLNRGFVKDLNGKQVLRSTSFPSPAPKNDALVRPWCWVQKDDDSGRVFKKVALESVPLMDEKDKDQRKPVKYRDMMTMDAPWKDTQKIFGSAIDTYKAMSGNEWEPGMLLFRDPETRSTMSHSSDFIPPSEMPVGEPSATFHAHTPVYPTPSGVGCGWGDYSRFQQWQSHGRVIKPSMVPDKTWSSAPSKSFAFVEDAPGGGETIIVNAEHAAFQPEQNEEIQSLRDRLVKKKSYQPAPSNTRNQRLSQDQSDQSKLSQLLGSSSDW
ncbi:hypothetical protein FAVG1_12381 [Fusarium avenaceum]|nr:hypothetical protein FAVG1_12381 [Fusarium avenaceum]